MDLNISCPVCTLYLRSGISLQQHLYTHPKEQVIEALVSISNQKAGNVVDTRRIQSDITVSSSFSHAPWNQNRVVVTNSPVVLPVSNNQSVIYQQITSTGTNLPMNSLVPQYIVTPTINQQMLMNPYLYQQQLQILTGPVSTLNRTIQTPTTIAPVNKQTTMTYCNIAPAPDRNQPINLSTVSEIKCIENKNEEDDTLIISELDKSLDTYDDTERHKDVDSLKINEFKIQNKEVDNERDVEHLTNDSIEERKQNVETHVIERRKCTEIETENLTINNFDILKKQRIGDCVIERRLSSPENLMSDVGNEVDTNNEVENLSINKYNQSTFSESLLPEIEIIEGDKNMSQYPKADDSSDITVVNTSIKSISTHTNNSRETYDEEEAELIVPDNETLHSIQKIHIVTNDDNEPKDFCINERNYDTNGHNYSNSNSNETTTRESSYNNQHLHELYDIDEKESILPDIIFKDTLKNEPKECINNERFDIKSDIIVLQDEVICLPNYTSNNIVTNEINEMESENKIDIKNEICEQLISNQTIISGKYLHIEIDNVSEEVEFNGMKLVVPGDLTSTPLKRNYDCVEEERENPPVLLDIGEMRKEQHEDENKENVNKNEIDIGAEESIFIREELSGGEGNGASNSGWGKNCQESSSGVSTSYDLIARESWEASDCSDTEVPPLQSRIPLNDSSMFKPKQKSSRQYTCSSCNASFPCPKERRVHLSKCRESSSVITSLKKEEIDMDDDQEINDGGFENAIQNDESHLKCQACNLVFLTVKQLTVHHRNTHKGKIIPKFTCSVCNENFKLESKYTEHLKVHPLECSICGKCFFRRQNLSIHLKRHSGIKPFKCETCMKSFLTKQKMNEHMNVHTGRAPLKCNLCDETFKRHSNLTQHRNTHHYHVRKKLKEFACHCGEVFHSKKKFLWHSEIHESKPKACGFCSEKFVHTASLTRHMRKAHNNYYIPDEKRKVENVECPVCKKVYLKSSLEIHMRTHDGVKAFSCNICSKEFSTNWNLKLHRWTHASRLSKPFKCNLCKSAFIRQGDYVAHMNSHRSVRPYTCNYCGRQFIRKYNCHRHVKEHEGNKSFKCSICGKEFHRSYYLKEHLRIHSGLRPYTCHICGKTSATKSNHNKHVRIHHAREPVSTEG